MSRISVEPANGEAAKIIDAGLMAFNRSNPAYRDGEMLTIVWRDDEDVVRAGALIKSRVPTLFVEELWVDDGCRGKGLGTLLMDEVEDFARKKGARMVYLDTYTFQAKPFYEKRGYVVFGELPEYFEGVARYWLRKSL